MKKMLSVLVFLALSACMGGGGSGGDVDITRTQIDIVANDQMGTLLEGARTGDDIDTGDPLSGLVYDARVAGVAQAHADDMLARNYLSIFELGSSGFDGPRGGERDMGDDLNALDLRWQEILQMVAQGDMTVQEVYTEFRNRPRDVIEGDFSGKWDDIEAFEAFEYFGLGKAGSGDDQRWALLIVWPNADWSSR